MQVSLGNEKSFRKLAKAAMFTKYGRFLNWRTSNTEPNFFRPYFSDV